MMELVFIRHGHGEHLIDYPNRLNMLNPGLTEYGVHQIQELRERFTIHPDDIVVASPTKRTIQTAQLLTNSQKFYISPHVGPRMFPQNPELPFLGCDRTYVKEEIIQNYPDVLIHDFGFQDWGEGINRMAQELFEAHGRQFLEWCRSQDRRVIIISHDGTITNYRLLLGEKGLTRRDFLGEAGVYRTHLLTNF